MSEERRQTHPEEPAEGSRKDMGEPDTGPTEEERSSAHPQEPAEGGDEEVDG